MMRVDVRDRALRDYRGIVDDSELAEIRALAERLKGERVVHISSTAYGGGVSEILHSMVPLMRDVGLDADWLVIKGDDTFYSVTKAFHNGLQGADVHVTEEMRKVYLEYNKTNAELFRDEGGGFVFVHDPQPAAMIADVKNGSRWIWRCHIDTSTPNPEVLAFLAPYLNLYDAAVFSMEKYLQPSLRFPYTAIVAPSIDPLSNKNRPMTQEEVEGIFRRFDIAPGRPIISQVARFDPYKDPLGVIDAYRMVKREVPSLKLLLITSMARDDPEGWPLYERTARHAGDDLDIHLLTNLIGVGNLEVNAFQRGSAVGVLKSLREGFGLSVSESLWKGVPVVGGNAGGIPLQVIPGETGFLVENAVEAADRVLTLLRNPGKSKGMGEAGREHVRKNFLITRHLKDYLRLLLKVRDLGSATAQ